MSNIVIVGSGPAGVSAALYAVRAGVDTTVLTKGPGALDRAEKIENYYGLAQPVSGAELERRSIENAKRLGVRFVTAEAVGLTYTDKLTVETIGEDYPADAVILATGASRAVPRIPGLAGLEGHGVSWCAVCDAFFYRGKDVAVLGSGAYALHEVQALLPVVKSVSLLTNGMPLTAEFPPEVTVYPQKVEAVLGEPVVTGVQLSDGQEVALSGVFVALGVAGSTALARKIGEQKDALTALQAHLAAWVDFPEEDVPELDEAHLRSVLGSVQETLDGLIRNYQADTVLREGVDCAIVGRPNAGKSTLLNLLAGFDRAIVTPVAGTTRDVVEQAVQLGDIRLNLFDTAGLRETEDAIEAEGIRRSWKKLEEAGLILAVFDGSEPPTREDLELARRCAGRPAIALVNKEDKPTQFDAELIAPYFAMVLPVCCQEEGSRKVIAAAVARLLGTSQIDPHAASLSGQRQLSAALRARDAAAGAREAVEAGFGLDAVSVCVDDALDALCELTGENASEAVIEQVFERFCVGK